MASFHGPKALCPFRNRAAKANFSSSIPYKIASGLPVVLLSKKIIKFHQFLFWKMQLEKMN